MYSALVLLPEKNAGFVMMTNGDADAARTVLTQVLVKHFSAPSSAPTVAAYARRLEAEQAQQRAAGQAEANRYSVALELQADCYAGVWAANAAAVSNGQVALEAGDLQEGMRTAQAIGDDTLQRRGGGRVSPESFTHGSSAQRVEWLQRGYQSGDPAACDTFSAI